MSIKKKTFEISIDCFAARQNIGIKCI